MFEKCDLGINEIENRNHWRDANRFKRILSDSREEPDYGAITRTLKAALEMPFQSGRSRRH
jgi:hypothetical protein